jgi:homoserine kinase type II
MDLTDLWQAWPAFGPWTFRASRNIANNLVQVVDTPSAGSFVLRIYRHHRDERRVRYEHAVVTHLQYAQLPFTIPVPVPTGSGETVIRVPTDAGHVLASLWPLLPGTAADGQSLEQTYAAGEALARLDQALAQVRIEETLDVTPPPSYSDLCHRRPRVPDPVAAVAQLPIDDERKIRITRLVQEMVAIAPQLYAALPQQITHNDYDPSNILTEGTRVSGVLDFEFSTPDVRAMDLVVALHGWSSALLGSGREWEVMEAVGRGYTNRLPLSSLEIEAVPLLLRLRTTATLIYRVGRYWEAIDSQTNIINRVASVARLEDWLEAHGAELLRRARSW